MLRPANGQRRTTGGNFVRKNTVKSIWKRGGAAVNGWMGIPSSVAAEGMAQAGCDSLTADLQHALIDYQTAVSLFHAVSPTPTGAQSIGKSAGGGMY
jgi:2-keto-3-deoxy-L-rhamnonate aldolase RhmA